MPKVALLIFPGFSEFEISVATAVLRSSYQLVTLAGEMTPILSEAGLQMMPHASLDAVNAADYEALIIPGAGDMQPVMDAAPVHRLVQKMDSQGKLLAAICAGGIVLARAGVLKARPYTVSLYRHFRDFLGCFNEERFRYEPLVEAENLLTAQGFAFVEFGLRIGERLNAIRDLEGVRAYYRGQGDLSWEDEP